MKFNPNNIIPLHFLSFSYSKSFKYPISPFTCLHNIYFHAQKLKLWIYSLV